MGERSPLSSTMSVDEFVRRVLSHGKNLHWLMGAGVSQSAGVPTAWDMIYDFKATLYAQRKRIKLADLDTNDPDTRLRLDAYFLTQEDFPRPGDPSEYAVLFERVHSDPSSRQRKIEQMLEDADPQPNLGHLVIAVMWQMQLLHTAWTTNFDEVLEQAAVQVSNAARWLRRVDRSDPDQVRVVFEDQAKPVLVKMHGDFQSQRLDNTTSELEADNQLRSALSESMRTKGLVVVGYSGRDASVMDALTKALDAQHAFSSGLYWIVRPDDTRLSAVDELLSQAKAQGVEAHLVESPSFEELMTSIRLLLRTDDVQDALLNRFQPRSRISDFDIPSRGGKWPRIRLNAVAVAEYPSSCRVVSCEIGNTKEVRQVVAESGRDVIAARRRDGVIAFGRDEDLLEAFSGRDPKLTYGRLDPAYTADLGLLYDALVAALVRERPLLRRSSRIVTVDPARISDNLLSPLKRADVKYLTGRIPNNNGLWAEGIELQLEQRYQTLWLVYAPLVWSERGDDRDENNRRREWTRERQVKRYNRQSTALFKAWADVICGGAKESSIRSLGIDRMGTDGTFSLKRLAPYTERGRQ